ncbi:MAG: histidine triad nucleotide-binding protein [Elusimicrobiales bacterium]|nr:histidine triad nucleotide-binding protein [Elusimicrobiales bacterium]
MECIFCKIVKKEVKSKIIYEDEDIIAFNDLNPQAPTHILIIPKKHIESIINCKEEDVEILGKLAYTAKKIAEKLNITDFRIVNNCGKKAGQSVFHIHYHFLAGRRMGWPPG